MTGKELMYIEDALGHEKYFQTQCRTIAAQLQDEKLKQCVLQMAEKHRKIFRAFTACSKRRDDTWKRKT